MLQGLPRDLDPTEAAILRRSMPPALSESLSHHSHDVDLPDSYINTNSGPPSSPGEDRNLIHSFILFVLIYMKSWIMWIMPYILLLSGEVIRFEREHNVAGVMLNKCMAGMTASLQAIRAMSDGPLGQCVRSVLEYLAEGVSGALQEFARDWLVSKKEKERGPSYGSYGKSDKLGGIDGCGYGSGYGQPQQRHRQNQQQQTRGRIRVR